MVGDSSGHRFSDAAHVVKLIAPSGAGTDDFRKADFRHHPCSRLNIVTLS
jgi:hypothetical protein